MTDVKEERVKEIIRQKASQFLERQSNRAALITITGVTLSERGKRADIFLTVFPPESENSALDFAKRKRAEFRQVLKRESALFQLPFIDFKIDLGEKNRQKIDALSQKK